MANLIIQENGVERTTPALHGEEITIQTPCDCSAVSGVQIAGVAYPFYDAAGKPLPTGSGLFSEGNLIRVLIDTVNTRSTIINHAIPTPDVSGQINTHNSSSTAHSDIRTAVSNAQTAANNAQTTANSKAPMYQYSTTDLTAGSSPLESGTLYFVYE